jgi:ferredoxin-NAD(P)+ reductase (naphthalene dioxygenase ferredoxin-specific)
LSILRGAAADGMRNPIHVYFGVRSPRDIYGLDWLSDLQSRHPALQLNIVVASGGDPREHRCGVVTDAIGKDFETLAGWRAYVCGSPPLVEATSLLARHRGIDPARVYADAFYPQSN